MISRLEASRVDSGGTLVIRRAFRMSIHEGRAAEYERRHNPIWADLEEVLIRHGVASYSIFLDPATHDLFAYVEMEDEEMWNRIASTDVCQRWWRSMCELMPSHEDHSPVATPLREVFHIEGASTSVAS
jgi:L-rhamnose mutarotase